MHFYKVVKRNPIVRRKSSHINGIKLKSTSGVEEGDMKTHFVFIDEKIEISRCC